jgi:ribose transport system substrate-binding protein
MAAAARASALEEAALVVARASNQSAAWSGPVTGPQAQGGKTIAVVTEDLRNGGVLGASQGIREAAREIGWRVRIFDSGGTVAGRRRAITEALSAAPHGLVLCGMDAREAEREFRASGKRVPPVVGWHAGPTPGPLPDTAVAMNVTTDPIAVARTAALAAVVQSGGRANVIIFTDSRFSIAVAKSQAMADVIQACAACTLLAVRDVPISESAIRTPVEVRKLLDQYGARWTHALAINDIYFDHAVPILLNAGVPVDALRMLSAGDGSPPAFARVRAGLYQIGTVPEPLTMQGWQVVDELNRLMALEPVSGYAAPVHLTVVSNLAKDTSLQLSYDPDNGYRDIYRRIWHRP